MQKILRKRAVLIVLGIGAVAAIGNLTPSFGLARYQEANQSEKESWTKRNKMSARIRRAKAKGVKRLYVGSRIPEYDHVENLEQALNAYSVVIAHPVDKTSRVVLDDYIKTYYKLKIVEKLTWRPGRCCAPQNLAVELPALSDDEIYLQVGGGSLAIDGVEISSDGSIPRLSLGQNYLILFTVNKAQNLGLIGLGPYGVFQINPEGVLKPITKEIDPVRLELERGYSNELTKLKSYIKDRHSNAK